MADERENKMRTSHKIGIGFMGFMLSVSQFKTLKEVINGDTEKTLVRIEAHVQSIDAKLDANAKNAREDMEASEVRCEKRTDDIRSRVVNLEIYAFKQNREKSQN